MATGGGAGVEGRGWQVVGKSKGEKRVASSDRPDTSGVLGEIKLRKMSDPGEGIVMFKMKGQKPGEGGFRALNPLRVTAALVWDFRQGLCLMGCSVKTKNYLRRPRRWGNWW